MKEPVSIHPAFTELFGIVLALPGDGDERRNRAQKALESMPMATDVMSVSDRCLAADMIVATVDSALKHICDAVVRAHPALGNEAGTALLAMEMFRAIGGQCDSMAEAIAVHGAPPMVGRVVRSLPEEDQKRIMLGSIDYVRKMTERLMRGE